MTITDFMDEGATPTQQNPLALENPGYYYEDDESDIHEGQLRRVDEIYVGDTVHSRNQNGGDIGNKPMGSPTSTNSSTTSLIGALKKDDHLQPKKKKSLSWGKNQQEVFNAEAPIDPDASVRPMDEDDDVENGKPKITLYF